jgi:galactokinase
MAKHAHVIESQVDKAKIAFEERFGRQPDYIVRAPGRVNLIGEHTDYNQGFVFPTAIDREVIIAASKSEGSEVCVRSMDYGEEDQFELADIGKRNDRPWANYLRGVLSTLQKRGALLAGFDAVLTGNVPQGAGLSSSAAYEVAVATLCNKMNDLMLSPKDIALIAQRAENEFVGVQCGIMDQFISALAEEDSALLIDCRSLIARAVPLRLTAHDCSIVIINTGVQRGLVDSKYNERRAECARGVEKLSQLCGRTINSLRDIDLEEFEKLGGSLDKTVANRCRHVISENQRVLDAVCCLEDGDLNGFGQLMNASHASLRDHFQVSCPELDILVELSQSHADVIGARMTGGGFGGCAVALIRNSFLAEYNAKVAPEYQRRTGKVPTVYICRSTAGASSALAP